MLLADCSLMSRKTEALARDLPHSACSPLSLIPPRSPCVRRDLLSPPRSRRLSPPRDLGRLLLSAISRPLTALGRGTALRAISAVHCFSPADCSPAVHADHSHSAVHASCHSPIPSAILPFRCRAISPPRLWFNFFGLLFILVRIN